MTLPDRQFRVFAHLKKVMLLGENICSYENGDRGLQRMVLERGWESKAALSWPWVRAHPQDSSPGPGPCFCVIHLGGAGGPTSLNCAKPGLGTWGVSWQEHWSISRWHQVLTFAKLLQSENDGKWYKSNEGGTGLNNYRVDRTVDV